MRSPDSCTEFASGTLQIGIPCRSRPSKFASRRPHVRGRRCRRQLIQLGRRYEVERGLRAPKPRKRKRGDAWTEFLLALARVVKPAHRPAVERLVAALQPQPKAQAA